MASDTVTVDGLRYIRVDGCWYARPEGAPWRIPQDDDKSRMLTRIAELEATPAVGAAGEAVACTGCGSPRIAAIRAVIEGRISCCPDCSTLTMGERNNIREAVALRLAHPSGVWVSDAEINAAKRVIYDSGAAAGPDDTVLDQVMEERDDATDMADRLAAAIVQLTVGGLAEEVIGEHSLSNDPWENALELADNHAHPSAGAGVTEAFPVPDGYTQVAPNVYVSADRIVVTGTPSDVEDENDPAYHNCDAMGCRWEHVIYTAALSRPTSEGPTA